MRMWAVDPTAMCRQHLLGEHVEMHMFAGSSPDRVAAYGRLGLVKVDAIYARHRLLAYEMTRRGYRHASPIDRPPHDGSAGFLAPWRDTVELASRCPECLPDLQPYLHDHTHAKNAWPDPDRSAFWLAVDAKVNR